MAIKKLYIADIGEITLQKRQGSKSIRIRISQNGDVRVTQPTWLPFSAGAKFAQKQINWVKTHRPAQNLMLNDMKIGKHHFLKFIEKGVNKPRVKIKDHQAIVEYPLNNDINSSTVQSAAIRAAKKALIQESSILSERLNQIANIYDFEYKSVDFKFMKSRWGSCKSTKDITLNYRLLDIEESLIDYVIVHELSHTKYLDHSNSFWKTVGDCMPNYKILRKNLKEVKLNW